MLMSILSAYVLRPLWMCSLSGHWLVAGVVFNEMKGVYSQPDARLNRLTMHEMFPDTTYAVDSGGDPQVIPQLTFKQFQVSGEGGRPLWYAAGTPGYTAGAPVLSRGSLEPPPGSL